MKNRLFRYSLIVVILIAIVAAGYLIFQRNNLEETNNQVEVALFYDEIENLAKIYEKPTTELLSDFKKLGATGILFKEDSVKKILLENSLLSSNSTDIAAYSGKNIIAMNNGLKSTKNNIFDIRSEYMYITTYNKDTYLRIKRHLELEIPSKALHFPESDINGMYLLGIMPQYGEIYLKKNSIGIGFPRERLREVKENDLNVLLQFSSWLVSDSDEIKTVYELYQSELTPFKDKISLIAFNDAEVPGFPNKLASLATEIDKFSAPVGFIETFIYKQQAPSMKKVGLETLPDGRSMNKKIAKVHSVTAGEMARYTTPEALERMFLAASERNVRVLLVRLFPDDGTGASFEVNKEYIKRLTQGLKERGFTLGKASTFTTDVTSGKGHNLLNFLIGLGVIAAFILLCDSIGLAKIGIWCSLIGTLGWLAVFILQFFNPFDFGKLMELLVKMMALLAIVIFPTLSITVVVRRRKMDLLPTIVQFLRIVAISLIGAFLMVGLLADVDYMLKLKQFSGVKVGLALPILFVILIFYLWKDKGNRISRVKKLLDKPLNVSVLIVLGVFAGILMLVLLRSGNTGSISGLEEHFRSTLQGIMIRPRTKELLGHPLMLVLLYYGYRHSLLPLLIFGTIGQVSMVNTFVHTHTPLYVSFIRTFNGLWIGIIIGIFLIIICNQFLRLKERYFHEESSE